MIKIIQTIAAYSSHCIIRVPNSALLKDISLHAARNNIEGRNDRGKTQQWNMRHRLALWVLPVSANLILDVEISELGHAREDEGNKKYRRSIFFWMNVRNRWTYNGTSSPPLQLPKMCSSLIGLLSSIFTNRKMNSDHTCKLSKLWRHGVYCTSSLTNVNVLRSASLILSPVLTLPDKTWIKACLIPGTKRRYLILFDHLHWCGLPGTTVHRLNLPRALRYKKP